MADTPTQAQLPFEGPPQPENSPPSRVTELWSWTDLVLFLAFAVFAFLFANFLIALGLTALRQFEGWPAIPPQIQNNPLVSLAVELVFYILIATFIYALVVAYHGQPFWPSLKGRRPTLGQCVGYTVGGFMMAVGVQLAPTLLPDKQDFPLERMLNTPLAAYSLGAFAIFVAPLMEELIFRGVIFSVLERRVNVLFAIVATAALFGALHIQEYAGAWNHVLLIFIVGGIFSLTRGLSRSITPGIILHCAYNFSLMAGFFIQTGGFRHFGAL